MSKGFYCKMLQGVVLSILTISAFVLIYFTVFEIDYHNTGGAYMAVSASTIKFVNQWLEEGALKLHFTCYEYFDSIEFHSLSERYPYVSYPSGSTFLIWILAKLMGRQHIGISFLKHVQAVFLSIEMLAAAFFTCCLLRHSGFVRKAENMIISVATAVFWLYLPGTAWYLSNILFADQVVILHIMLFILLEYINDVAENSRLIVFMRICKAGVIYMGVLTDYYFWIFAFFIFMMKCIRFILVQTKLKYVVSGLLEYVVPVVCGLGTFLWQISYTENWIAILKKKFVYRTGGEAAGSLFENFCAVYTGGNTMRGAHGAAFYNTRVPEGQRMDGGLSFRGGNLQYF